MTTDAKSPGLSEPLCHVPPWVLEEPPVPEARFSGGQLQVVCTQHTGTQCLGAGGVGLKAVPSVSGASSPAAAFPRLGLRVGAVMAANGLAYSPGQHHAHRVRPCQVLPALRGHGSDHVLHGGRGPSAPHVSPRWACSLTFSFRLEHAQKI